mmetsp:Transcript_44527/g.105991  ORF Transcript_44527/g.105991 Transcript_44527/m.105991 type:complete len:276 (+) Transcript_44527:1339-2166(+)
MERPRRPRSRSASRQLDTVMVMYSLSQCSLKTVSMAARSCFGNACQHASRYLRLRCMRSTYFFFSRIPLMAASLILLLSLFDRSEITCPSDSEEVPRPLSESSWASSRGLPAFSSRGDALQEARRHVAAARARRSERSARSSSRISAKLLTPCSGCGVCSLAASASRFWRKRAASSRPRWASSSNKRFLICALSRFWRSNSCCTTGTLPRQMRPSSGSPSSARAALASFSGTARNVSVSAAGSSVSSLASCAQFINRGLRAPIHTDRSFRPGDVG